MIAKVGFLFGKLQARAAMLRATPLVRGTKGPPRRQHPHDEDMARLVDSTLEDSVPASDPPSWTASIVRLAPVAQVSVRAGDAGSMRRAVQRAAALC